MKFDISIIEERIKELGSKEKVLEYLNRLLFDWKKRKIEFGAYDKTELKRLKEITKDDYKAYKNEFDNDRLVYFDNGKSEKAIAERVGIKNLELLKKRLRLEFHKEDIDAKISLIKGLIKREQEKSIPNKSDFTKDKLDSLIITLTALKGYEKPSTYLNEMLERVRLLNDTDFEFNFFLNVFHSCKDNAEKFWSEGHKKDISEWFSKCPYPAHLIKKNEMVNLFDTLWDNTPPPIVESPFSVLEWATIFYYADETKLLTESRLIKTRLEQFMSKHQINTTFDNFKTKYYEAKKRINEKNDYPINKLELIIPFLKENYKQTVTKVENDIIFLEENKPEY